MTKEELLRQLFDKLIDSKQGKIIKTLPLRKEWQKLWKDYNDAVSIYESAENKLATKKKLFWATVESDLDNYDCQMSVNEKTMELEIRDKHSHDHDNESDHTKVKSKIKKGVTAAEGSYEA